MPSTVADAEPEPLSSLAEEPVADAEPVAAVEPVAATDE